MPHTSMRGKNATAGAGAAPPRAPRAGAAELYRRSPAPLRFGWREVTGRVTHVRACTQPQKLQRGRRRVLRRKQKGRFGARRCSAAWSVHVRTALYQQCHELRTVSGRGHVQQRAAVWAPRVQVQARFARGQKFGQPFDGRAWRTDCSEQLTKQRYPVACHARRTGRRKMLKLRTTRRTAELAKSSAGSRACPRRRNIMDSHRQQL